MSSSSAGNPTPAPSPGPRRKRVLHIGLDALALRPGVNGGGEMYIRSLVSALAQVDGHNEYHVFVTPRSAHLFDDLPDRFRRIICRFPGGSVELPFRIAWEWSVLRYQAVGRGLDIMHFPGNILPAAFPVPSVLTVHDFSSLFYREQLGVRLSPAMRLLDQQRILSCGRAEHTVAISRFTADEILQRTAIDPRRLHVVHLAARDFQIPALDTARQTLRRYGIDGPYILSVATLNHHKNLLRLLEAYASVREDCGRDLPLVLVGRAGSVAHELRRELDRLGIAEHVILAGYVPDAEIPAFYRAAELYVFPSLYEGFGMPLLEAAACGTPVLAARAGSLPEIGGDAALYFDPWDKQDIESVLRGALCSPELLRDLASRGPAQAAKFSWKTTAERMIAVFEAAAGRDPFRVSSPANGSTGEPPLVDADRAADHRLKDAQIVRVTTGLQTNRGASESRKTTPGDL